MKRREFMMGSMAGAGALAASLARAEILSPCPVPVFKIDGDTSSVNSCSTSNSALADLVRSMTAGTWREVSPTPVDLATTLGAGISTGNMIPYCNAAAWNPISKRIEILGQDHGWGNMRHVQYDVGTNAFVFVSNIGTDQGHGYDHYNVNPVTGDLYYKEYAGSTGGRLWKKPYGGSWSSSFTTVPIWQQVAIGTAWWTGPMTPSIGSQGVFLLADTDFGRLAAYDPVNASWFTFGPVSVNPTYHSVMAYSRTHNCAVFGGGNNMPRRMWRVNANRTLTELTAAPANCVVGIQRGGLVCDPATGYFLVLSGGNLFELDPTGSGTWRQLTGSRTPPSAVNNPTALQSMIMCELPEHGAVAVVSMNAKVGNMYIYKHA